jgi:hypothetical protein
MHLIVYGDFNCPFSYLASQRVDELARLGQAEVEWRAVEHDPALALTGTSSRLEPDRWQRQLAELALLADEDEQAPGAAPSVISRRWVPQPASRTPRNTAASALIAVSAPKTASPVRLRARACSAAATPETATTAILTIRVVS